MARWREDLGRGRQGTSRGSPAPHAHAHSGRDVLPLRLLFYSPVLLAALGVPGLVAVPPSPPPWSRGLSLVPVTKFPSLQGHQPWDFRPPYSSAITS